MTPFLNVLKILDDITKANQHDGEDTPSDQKSDGNGVHFFAQGHFPVSNLSVNATGYGTLQPILSALQAQELQSLGSPSRFGLREQTLLDPNVRSSNEIAADAIQITWAENAFETLLDEVARKLNAQNLQARLHNLLIYGPGQFFKQHQDSEKHPQMVATLVLIWPCAHIGGKLSVKLGDSKERFQSQQLGTDPEIRWCAFYADCKHEVLPVKEGWRVALSFDLVVPKDSPVKTQTANPSLVAALREDLGVGTATPYLQPWIFLLDHQYTKQGLRWHLLKGDDRTYVTALRIAAEELGLSLHLALVEIQETWSTDYEDNEPEELLDDLLTLDFWVDAGGHVSAREKLSIDPKKAYSFTETDEEYLVKEEFEDYTGNEGASVDFWYRRAALVIESKVALLYGRFITNFDESLAKLRADSKDPDKREQVAAAVSNLSDIFKKHIDRTKNSLFANMADIAMALPAEQAHSLMANFNPTNFTVSDVPVIAKLESTLGQQWMLALIGIWADPNLRTRSYTESALTNYPLWPKPLLAFIVACVKARMSAVVLTEAMHQNVLELSRLLSEFAKLSQVSIQSMRSKLLDLTCDMAAAIRVVEPSGGNLARALILLISEQPTLYPLDSLGPLFAHCVSTDYTNKLRENAVGAIRKIISTFERDPDDYTVRNVIWQCNCKDCTQVINWAQSRTNVRLDLAMSEQRRRHIESSLRAAHAPFGMETIKRGSPYSLVLSKPTNLHEADKATRDRLQRDIDSLTA